MKIIGEWGYFVTTSMKGNIQTETNCNACPKIIFRTNGTAKVIENSKDIENYNWIIKGDTILFSYNNISYNTFQDIKYQIIFTDKHEFIELELKQIEKNYSCILRK